MTFARGESACESRSLVSSSTVPKSPIISHHPVMCNDLLHLSYFAFTSFAPKHDYFCLNIRPIRRVAAARSTFLPTSCSPIFLQSSSRRHAVHSARGWAIQTKRCSLSDANTCLRRATLSGFCVFSSFCMYCSILAGKTFVRKSIHIYIYGYKYIYIYMESVGGREAATGLEGGLSRRRQHTTAGAMTSAKYAEFAPVWLAPRRGAGRGSSGRRRRVRGLRRPPPFCCAYRI